MRSSGMLSSIALGLLVTLGVRPVVAQRPCVPVAGPEASALLARADSAMQVDRAAGKAYHWVGNRSTLENYQSDRTYPPFFSTFMSEEGWYAPATGALRTRGRVSYLSYGTNDAPEILSGPTATWLVRDTAYRAMPSLRSAGDLARGMDPWAVVRDWRSGPSVRVEGRCTYRDYPRVVLTRTAEGQTERLFLDPKTGFPVKLERREPHYLWGDQLVEYVWSNWIDVGGAMSPGSTFRMVDGETEVSRTVATGSLVSRDSAPALTLPDPGLVQAHALPAFLEPTPPDTIRVSDRTFLLKNRGYTETVTLQRDTVFVLDATQGEARARADSSWIARLFPGPHPIVVVVTDLAWPHVAGIRFWAARGATIVAHRAAEPFLRQVLDRRWIIAPDLYERLRAARQLPRLRLRTVDASLVLAGGDLTLQPIDGITSEVALIGWIPGDRFLWASDYIQTAAGPTEYTAEVRAAARRAGITPARVAAEHLPLTPWATFDTMYAGR